MQKLLLIVGPTAIGKTSLGLKLAEQFNGEIISGDSMQVYQELSIGTAKPNDAELTLVPHYLVNEKSVYEEFGVKEFVELAQEAIVKISQSGHLPVIVGGTGFYLSALLYGLRLGEKEDISASVDQEFETKLAQMGPEKLWSELNAVDHVAASKIPYQNSRRVMRALTVIKRTGKKFSSQQEQLTPQYDFLIIGLNSDRQLVYDRINQRVDQMVATGVLEEAKFLHDNLGKVKQAKQAIGYKEFFAFLEGQENLTQATDRLKQASRKYAKRQLTYFNNKLPTKWFDPLRDQNADQKITKTIEEWEKDYEN